MPATPAMPTLITVNSRAGVSAANDASWSGVKQTTSQRPVPGRSSAGSASGSCGAADIANDGKRFSKTTTS